MHEFYTKHKNAANTSNALGRILLILVVICLMMQPLTVLGYAQTSLNGSILDNLGMSDETTDSDNLPSDESEEDTTQEEEQEQEYREQIEISDVAGLKALAQRVNNGDDMAHVLVTITEDIVLDAKEQWIPIGYSASTPFKGTFDGGNKTISGITVNKKAANDDASEDGSEENASEDASEEEASLGGLFGFLYEATIRDVILKKVDAPNSISGLYFSAVRSTITGCFKKWGLFGLFAAGIRPFSDPPPWDGTQDTSLNTSSQMIGITTPQQLAQIANLVNTGAESFAGKTIYLEVNLDLNGSNYNWTPIGDNTNPFKGHLIGNTCVISNIKVTDPGGLFGHIQAGSINNLIIDNATVETTSDTGILASKSESSITGVVIKDSYISAGQAAGIVHNQFYDQYAPLIRPIAQCVVMNTTVYSPSGSASGIVHENHNVAVTQCAVYNCVLEGATASGIANITEGPGASYSGISQNIVLATKFLADNASGLLSDVGNSYNSLSDNFVSDLDLPADAFLTMPNPIFGIDSNFTDSSLENNFIPYLDYYTTNNVFDISTVDGVRPDEGRIESETAQQAKMDGNAFYKTNYLTGGAWKPNDLYWSSIKGYYPYLKNTMGANTPYLSHITGLASVAVLLDDPNPETTLYGSKEFRLVDKTLNGNTITWTATDSANNPIFIGGSSILTKRGDNSQILYTHDNSDVKNFNLKASITVDGVTLEKNFKNLTLQDGLLSEDVDARYPMGTTPIQTTDIPKLVFNDPVIHNPSAQGMIRLSAKKADGDPYTMQAVLPCDAANITINNIGGKYEVTLPNLKLVEGRYYKLVIPRGAVVEIDAALRPKSNYSEEITLEFQTISRYAPYIVMDTNKSIYVDTPLTLNDVKTWFEVYELYGSNQAMHSIAKGLDTAIQITTVVNDPKATLSALTTPGVYYYVDPAVIGSSHTAGAYNVHVFALNNQGMRSRGILTVEISSLPGWDSDPPKVAHTLLPENETDITALLRGSARASYTNSRGQKQPVGVEAEVDAADWAAYKASAPYPGKVKVYFYMVDFSGNRITTDVKETLVYLDRGLKYSFNTGYMSYEADEDLTDYEWMKKIEEGFDFVALNFADTAKVRFDHGSNEYRENGRYIVKMETAQQVLTLCDGSAPCSSANHSKLEDRVRLKFTVTIKDAKDPNEDTFWKKVRNDVMLYDLNYGVGRTIHPKMPIPDEGEDQKKYQYMDMPSEIIDMLRTHPYNRLELNYPAFRWKFYGKEMQSVPLEQSIYPLKVRLLEDSYITRDIGKDTLAVQLGFEYVGSLHGRVEFAYNLYNGGLTREQVAGKEFYFYKYDASEHKLIPVADVLVDADGWASAVLTRLEDTEYVIAEKKFGGASYTRTIGYGSGFNNKTVVVTNGNVLLNREVPDWNNDWDMFLDLTPEEMESRRSYYTQLNEPPVQQTMAEIDSFVGVSPEQDKPSKSMRILLLTGLLGVAGIAAGFAVYRRRKGGSEA